MRITKSFKKYFILSLSIGGDLMVKCDSCEKETKEFHQVGERNLCFDCYADFDDIKESTKKSKLMKLQLIFFFKF